MNFAISEIIIIRFKIVNTKTQSVIIAKRKIILTRYVFRRETEKNKAVPNVKTVRGGVKCINIEIFSNEYQVLNLLTNTKAIVRICINLHLDGNEIDLELDTGASYGIIDDNLFKKYWSDKILDKSQSIALTR